MNKGTKRALLWATTVLSLAVPAMAQAQTADDEIIVTARRREESQQDVPLAVSTLSADQMERANVTDVNSLQGTVPNLVISPGQGSGSSTPVFAIRGLSQQDLTHLSDPSVSLYINDVVVPRPIGGNVGFFDVQNVQVLRGPQGTLFGRNTPGGAVLVTTRLPTNDFEGYISQTVGNLETYNTEAAINFPVGDALSIRIAGMHRESDGFIEDVNTGQNINTVDESGLRISADFHPNNAFNSVFIVDFAETDNGGTGSFAQPGSNGGAAQLARDDYHTASGVPMHSDIDIFSFTNRTTLELNENITLRNIAAYRELQNDTLEDTDGSANFILTIQRFTEQQQFSNEFQILGDHSWGNWIAGAYFFNETGDDQGASAGAFAGGGADPGLIEPNTDLRLYPIFSNTWSQADNTSYGLFAQATVNLDALADGLSTTIGVRQNWDTREATILNRTRTACRFTVDADNNPATPEVNPGLAGCSLTLEEDFSEPTYNLSLEYEASDGVLLYAAHRHGYRTGGFGARATTEAGLSRTFEPETVDDFEIGVKADWRLGGMFVRTNIAGFFAEYTDIQRLLTDPTTIPVTTVTTNAGEAEIHGVELEFLIRPTDWLEFSGFYAYTETDFVEFIAPDGTDLSNAPFARAPRNISGASVRVDLPLEPSLGDASVGVSYYHQDRYSANDNFIPAIHWQEGYDLFNFNGEWNGAMGSPVDVLFFVNNAFENEYTTSVLAIGAATVNSATPAEPRTYGIRLRYNFGGE
ncbi:MAG: TonB-dependent receptor [Hyphomonadaceae bacterium]